jgi:hypothetical protein
MTVTLTLNPEVEKGLLARARERGMSLDVYLQEIVAREAGVPPSLPCSPNAKNLSDLLLNSPFAGAGLNLERSRDYPRPIELE